MRQRATHQVRVTAHRKHHDDALSQDHDPCANQPDRPLYNCIVFKLLHDFVSRVFGSDVITQQMSSPLQ